MEQARYATRFPNVEAYVWRRLFLMAFLALEAAAHSQRTPTLQERLSSPDGAARARAVRALSEQKVDLEWLGALRKTLEDPDRGVVQEGLRAWAKVGKSYEEELYTSVAYDDGTPPGMTSEGVQAWHRKLVASLVRIAERGDATSRRDALRTMCKLTTGADEICPPYGRCGTGAELTLSYKIDQALGEVAKVHPSALWILLDDPDPDVVYHALAPFYGSLWKSFQPRVKAYLEAPDKRFRAIGMWISQEAPFPARLRLVAPFLDDADADLRRTAETRLLMPEDEARRLAIAAPGRSLSLRVAAIDRLWGDEDPKRDALLRRLFDDLEPRIRNAALERFGDRNQAADLVRRGLDDPSSLVRATALMAGARSSMPGLLPVVRASLLSESRELRNAAIWCTMHVEGAKELTPEVIRAVEMGVSQNWMASPDFDDPRFAPLVETCLHSKSPDVRELLCFYFSREGSPKPVETMIRLAHDPDPEVARLMAGDLGKLSDPRAYGTLVELTASNSLGVRIASITALGQTKWTGALPILKDLLSDESREVRFRAKWALRELEAGLRAP